MLIGIYAPQINPYKAETRVQTPLTTPWEWVKVQIIFAKIVPKSEVIIIPRTINKISTKVI